MKYNKKDKKEKKQINIDIGANIKIIRESMNLSQLSFAELLECSLQNVSDIERGVSGISLTSLKKICDVSGVDSDIILFGTKTKNPETEILLNQLSNLSENKFKVLRKIINSINEFDKTR